MTCRFLVDQLYLDKAGGEKGSAEHFNEERNAELPVKWSAQEVSNYSELEDY